VAPMAARHPRRLQGSKGKFSDHERIARWTLPLWAYVSITGVLIYFVLYTRSTRLLTPDLRYLLICRPEDCIKPVGARHAVPLYDYNCELKSND
jgi:hypothetical protein